MRSKHNVVEKINGNTSTPIYSRTIIFKNVNL